MNHPDAAAPRLFGYARVSTDDQDLSLQIDALTQQGIAKTAIFMDKVSRAKTERPGLSKCLETLTSGDILVVWRLDRLGRSMQHLITLVEGLRSKGIGFRSLNEGAIDTTSASGELIFNIFSANQSATTTGGTFPARLLGADERCQWSKSHNCAHQGSDYHSEYR